MGLELNFGAPGAGLDTHALKSILLLIIRIQAKSGPLIFNAVKHQNTVKKERKSNSKGCNLLKNTVELKTMS